MGGRLGPTVEVDGALVMGVFLLRVSEVDVVEEGVGRLVGAVVKPPLAVVELGRVLAAALNLVTPAAGYDM